MHYHRVTRVCDLSNGAQDTPLCQLFMVSFYLRYSTFSERTRFIFVRFFLAHFYLPDFIFSERIWIDKPHGTDGGIFLPKNEDIIDAKWHCKIELIRKALGDTKCCNSKIWIWRKRVQKLKSITTFHFLITFHKFVFKTKTG